MDFSEFDYNLAESELVDGTVKLILGDSDWSVSAVISKKYARKEVDGRFTTDLPTYTLSVLIAESQIPNELSEDDYRLLNVEVEGITYAVRYVTGTGMLTLTLKPLDAVDESSDDSDGDDEEI